MEYIKSKELPPNPRERANIFSYVFFCWVMPVFAKGRKKELDTEDLYKPLNDHKSDNLGNRLCIAWENEVKKNANKGTTPSLLRATLNVFGWQIVKLGLILAAMEFLLRLQQPQYLGALVSHFTQRSSIMTNATVTQPIFMGGLISYYSNNSRSINEAYFYAAAVILCSAINVIIMHPFVLSQLHVGMKLRVAMCSMIYRKSLRLSRNALGDTTVGQVVNLLSNDVGRLDLSIMFIHYLWVGPLETVIVTYLMWREIGPSAMFGVIFMLGFIPLQGFLGKKTSVLRLRTALRTDERVRLMNEIIQGIQVIKMYAWEKPFGKMIALARKKEIKVIKYVSYIRGVLLSFIMFTTRVSIFISLIGYALLGQIVTAEKAFVITAYYNILRQTMTVFFPQGIGQLAETLVSIKRIQKFMMYEETTKEHLKSNGIKETLLTDTAVNYNTTINSDLNGSVDNHQHHHHHVVVNEKKPAAHLSNAGIIVSNVKARWDPDATEYTLNNVNLHVQPGTLVAIIGPVGASKSSLLQAILGELPLEMGKIEVNGDVSYASQEPWLFSGTIRTNILFGLPMDRERYRQVVKKCALERDFSLFPNGDKTIVGDRGQSLSGGQKARINLARACYRKASIYLLDDPLSAVDTHVGKHLFEQCLRNFLNGTIVVLITHQLQYLQHADQIVILKHGCVEAVGPYDTLRASGLDFAKLLLDTSKDEANTGDDSSLHRSKSGSRLHNRQNSNGSTQSLEEQMSGGDSPVQVEEKRAAGSIGFSLYGNYFKAGGGYFFFYIMVIFCVTAQIIASGGDYFLTYWVRKEEERQFELETESPLSDVDSMLDSGSNSLLLMNGTRIYDNYGGGGGFTDSSENYIDDNMLKDMLRTVQDERLIDIYIFSAITIATIIVTIFRTFLFFNLAMRASRNLHNLMFEGVTRATMFFFNTNPSGRILNRFSKDMGQVDEILPAVMIDVIQIFLQLGGIVIVVAVVNYWFLIPTFIIGVIFYFLRDFYLMSSRNIKRMEATTRSPIYSHLGASLSGLTTIRAFNAQAILTKEFDKLQDLHSSAFYLFIATSRAFGFWLDIFCVIYIAIVTLSFFVMGGDTYGGNIGLAITQAMGMTGMVQWGMRQSAELENTMTAVERVVEYETIDPEDDLESKTADKKPPKEWPENGHIEFKKLSLRYAPPPPVESTTTATTQSPTDSTTAATNTSNNTTIDGDIVLKELEFEVLPCEKIGIVGRTGAGKSSLINAMFRLSYNEGSIVIDSRDTQSMGLHELRQKISIIPQEPVLFSGTMRYNLDPFEEYSDDKLWSALEEVKLKEAINELPYGLQSRISEGGANFSVGQRQLVCLARAILRENKILVMDEATANVDPQTDGLIQTTIRNKFENCTILTIAHRLNTVMDCDKVLVMDAGRVIEFGTPYELLIATTGPKLFLSMVKETGRSTYESLLSTAKQTYENRKKK